MEALNVDGARPAVARVAALPMSWTTDGERLVLFVLACDAYDGETALPGYDNIAAWTGMRRASVGRILARLTQQTSYRPALLAREHSTRGGRRTVWRLHLPEPSTHDGRMGYPQPSTQGDGLNRPPTPDGKGALTVAQPSPNRPPTVDGNRPPTQDTPVTPLDPSVVAVGGNGADTRELPGQISVEEAIALSELASPRTLTLVQEIRIADPPNAEPTELERLMAATGCPCSNSSHSPRRRRGKWECPECEKAKSA
jgi:hypothetical protein